jgi:glycosyltransferase involved in cell wall biosynthesis
VSTLAEQRSPSIPAPASDLAGLRVLLVHQWMYTWAGAERVTEQLAELMPHADILSGIVTPQMRDANAVARRARESWVGRLPGAYSRHRWLLPFHAAAFRAFDTSSYDLIVSVSHAFEKSIRRSRTEAAHLCYCLSPPRYLWDLSEAHQRYATPLERAALWTMKTPLRLVDRLGAAGVDHFVSLSAFVADRVRRTYGRDSSIVYPPVEAKPTSGPQARENFLLTIGRLVPYKRVDLAIAAANRLGMRLVIAGDGPERGRLQAMATSQTTFLGQVSESEAGRLLSTCAAFVFCAEEDFGLAPVEANAHGTPVVAYGRGGALETMREGRTAVFFRDATADSLAAAIRRCLSTSWDESELRRNAQRFSPRQFREGMRAEIARALEQRRG